MIVSHTILKTSKTVFYSGIFSTESNKIFFTLHLSHISFSCATSWFIPIFPSWTVAWCRLGVATDSSIFTVDFSQDMNSPSAPLPPRTLKWNVESQLQEYLIRLESFHIYTETWLSVNSCRSLELDASRGLFLFLVLKYQTIFSSDSLGWRLRLLV